MTKKLKGKDIIKWIIENNLEESDVFMHVNEKCVVESVADEQLVIDECGDILICNRQE